MSEAQTKTFAVKADVRIPRVPNFLLFTDSEQKISIADLTDDGLAEIGRLWTENLIERAREVRREARKEKK